MNDNVIPLGPRRIVAQDDCRAWTPRELLAHLILKIDDPEDSFKPSTMLVCYTQKYLEGTVTGMRCSQASLLESIGMIETVKHDLLEQAL